MSRRPRTAVRQKQRWGWRGGRERAVNNLRHKHMPHPVSTKSHWKNTAVRQRLSPVWAFCHLHRDVYVAAGGGTEEKEEQEEVGVRAIAVCEEQRLCREAADRGCHLYSEECRGTLVVQCKCPDCCNPTDNSAVKKTVGGRGGGRTNER